MPMKNREHNQRFYLWDYLWWQGEMIRLHLLRPQTRMNGCLIVFGYIMALIIVPLIFLSYRLFPHAIIPVIGWSIVIIAGFSWIERIYRTRGKAVVKHYTKRSFYPIIGILLFLIPFAIMFTTAYYFKMLFHN